MIENSALATTTANKVYTYNPDKSNNNSINLIGNSNHPNKNKSVTPHDYFYSPDEDQYNRRFRPAFYGEAFYNEAFYNEAFYNKAFYNKASIVQLFDKSILQLGYLYLSKAWRTSDTQRRLLKKEVSNDYPAPNPSCETMLETVLESMNMISCPGTAEGQTTITMDTSTNTHSTSAPSVTGITSKSICLKTTTDSQPPDENQPIHNHRWEKIDCALCNGPCNCEDCQKYLSQGYSTPDDEKETPRQNPPVRVIASGFKSLMKIGSGSFMATSPERLSIWKQQGQEWTATDSKVGQGIILILTDGSFLLWDTEGYLRRYNLNSKSDIGFHSMDVTKPSREMFTLADMYFVTRVNNNVYIHNANHHPSKILSENALKITYINKSSFLITEQGRIIRKIVYQGAYWINLSNIEIPEYHNLVQLFHTHFGETLILAKNNDEKYFLWSSHNQFGSCHSGLWKSMPHLKAKQFTLFDSNRLLTWSKDENNPSILYISFWKKNRLSSWFKLTKTIIKENQPITKESVKTLELSNGRILIAVNTETGAEYYIQQNTQLFLLSESDGYCRTIKIHEKGGSIVVKILEMQENKIIIQYTNYAPLGDHEIEELDLTEFSPE